MEPMIDPVPPPTPEMLAEFGRVLCLLAWNDLSSRAVTYDGAAICVEWRGPGWGASIFVCRKAEDSGWNYVSSRGVVESGADVVSARIVELIRSLP